MATPLVSDALWAVVEPLLPSPPPPSPKGGRPRLPDRAAFTGIMYILQTGSAWRQLPPDLGCGAGVTCWRRLRDWQQAGVWDRLHHTLLDRLGEMGRIDWERACLDSAKLPAKKGATTRLRSAPIPPTGGAPAPSAI